MLEVASAKIDRFGWASMDNNMKNAICYDWVEALRFKTLSEIKRGIDAVFKRSGGNIRSINEHQVLSEISKIHKREFELLPNDIQQN